MELILSDIDFPSNRLVVFLQFVEVVDAVIGNADGTSLSRLLGFDESTPRAFASFFSAIGRMNEYPATKAQVSSIFPDLEILRTVRLTGRNSQF